MLLQLSLVDPRYIRDNNGSKCNYLVVDFLQLMGLPCPKALANDLIVRWSSVANVDTMVEMSIEDAVTNANIGCPTVAGLTEEGHGHVMVVLPQDHTEQPANLLIAQAGAVNFYGKRMCYGVPLKLCPTVRFFGAP